MLQHVVIERFYNNQSISVKLIHTCVPSGYITTEFWTGNGGTFGTVEVAVGAGHVTKVPDPD